MLPSVGTEIFGEYKKRRRSSRATP